MVRTAQTPRRAWFISKMRFMVRHPTVARVVTERSSRSRRRARKPCLHSFAGGSDGAVPLAGLVAVSGALYGTTAVNGGSRCQWNGLQDHLQRATKPCSTASERRATAVSERGLDQRRRHALRHDGGRWYSGHRSGLRHHDVRRGIRTLLLALHTRRRGTDGGSHRCRTARSTVPPRVAGVLTGDRFRPAVVT